MGLCTLMNPNMLIYIMFLIIKDLFLELNQKIYLEGILQSAPILELKNLMKSDSLERILIIIKSKLNYISFIIKFSWQYNPISKAIGGFKNKTNNFTNDMTVCITYLYIYIYLCIHVIIYFNY